MKHINIYINEAWGGMKKHTQNLDIDAWCEEMGIESYTINSKGEIDVNGDVFLHDCSFEVLPYKFGKVMGDFSIMHSNIKSLYNCPTKVYGDFYCSHSKELETLEGSPEYVRGVFSCSKCKKLTSFEGCPKKVIKSFICDKVNMYGKEFTQEDVKKYCDVKGSIILWDR